MVTDDLRRYTAVLRELIEDQPLPAAELERRLRWSKGTISKLLRGRTELKVRQLLAILTEIRIDPLLFFTRTHATRGDITSADKAIRHFEALGTPVHPITLLSTLSADELSRLIEEAVARALGKVEKGRS